ncbi:MAG: PAS domain S-box protein [Acidimicrobiales bacterium]
MSGFDRGLIAEAAAAAPDAIVALDANGVVCYWNHGAERIFGYQAHEMIGGALDPIIPERLRDRHGEGFTDAMERGTTRYGEDDLLAVPATTSAGKTISVEFSITLLREGDRVTHVMAILRDVTERWTHDRETRRRLEALEAQLAASEVPSG